MTNKSILKMNFEIYVFLFGIFFFYRVYNFLFIIFAVINKSIKFVLILEMHIQLQTKA
jgi:hypothetical protein